MPLAEVQVQATEWGQFWLQIVVTVVPVLAGLVFTAGVLYRRVSTLSDRVQKLEDLPKTTIETRDDVKALRSEVLALREGQASLGKRQDEQAEITSKIRERLAALEAYACIGHLPSLIGQEPMGKKAAG